MKIVNFWQVKVNDNLPDGSLHSTTYYFEQYSSILQSIEATWRNFDQKPQKLNLTPFNPDHCVWTLDNRVVVEATRHHGEILQAWTHF